MLRKIDHLLSAMIFSFIGAFACHSLYLSLDFLFRPHVYAAYSAPWYLSIFVNGLITALIALVIFFIRLLAKRFLPK